MSLVVLNNNSKNNLKELFVILISSPRARWTTKKVPNSVWNGKKRKNIFSFNISISTLSNTAVILERQKEHVLFVSASKPDGEIALSLPSHSKIIFQLPCSALPIAFKNLTQNKKIIKNSKSEKEEAENCDEILHKCPVDPIWSTGHLWQLTLSN